MNDEARVPCTAASRRVAWMLATSLALSFVREAPARALVGGEPARDGTYPFVAKVEVGSTRSCTGSLVAARMVLTTATCFGDQAKPNGIVVPHEPTSVLVGRADLTSAMGQVVAVESVVFHADRNLAIAVLAAPVEDIVPVPLGAVARVGESLSIAGFGRTASTWIPNRLHTGASTVQEVADATMQLRSSAEGEATPCKGDAGGPALRMTDGRAELVGVHHTSGQRGCYGVVGGEARALETRVDDLSAWIEAHAPREWCRWRGVVIRAHANDMLVAAESQDGALDGMLRGRTPAAQRGPWEKFDVCTKGGRAGPYYLRAWTGRYVAVEIGHPGDDVDVLRARAAEPQEWEQFYVEELPSRRYALKAGINSAYVSTEVGYVGARYAMLRARAEALGPWEEFTFEPF